MIQIYLEKEKSRPMLAHGNGSSPASVGSDSESSQGFTSDNSSMILDQLQDEVSERFQPKKEASLLLSEVYSELDMGLRSSRVAECGSYLEYHVNEQEKKLHIANFCKDRLCPMCNWRRSLKIFGQVSQIMDVLEKQGYRFLFLTLTLKNCQVDDLPKTVQVLFDGWRYLYHESGVFKKSVEGTFRSLEITINKVNDYYHPHLHIILAVKADYFKHKYISQEQWSELWCKACDLDYNPIVDIRTIKSDSKGVSGAVAEVAKYAVKSTDFLNGEMKDKIAHVSAFLSALTKRRLCDMTGCFREARKQLALDDIENGDLVNIDSETFRDDIAYMIVRYHWKNGCYVNFKY